MDFKVLSLIWKSLQTSKINQAGTTCTTEPYSWSTFKMLQSRLKWMILIYQTTSKIARFRGGFMKLFLPNHLVSTGYVQDLCDVWTLTFLRPQHSMLRVRDRPDEIFERANFRHCIPDYIWDVVRLKNNTGH